MTDKRSANQRTVERWARMTAALFILCACAGLDLPVARAGVQSHEEQVHWGYEGFDRPEHWGRLSPAFELCGKGRQQSPIDIGPASAHSTDQIGFFYQPSETDPLNNGHTVQVTYDAGSYIELRGKLYALLQYHMHLPSEHTLDGRHYPGELHLVHRRGANEYVVVAIIFRVGQFNPTIELLLKNLPVTKGTRSHLDAKVNAADFLPRSLSYFYYEGSFTTPPCTEGIQWFVMKGMMEVSQEQLKEAEDFVKRSGLPPRDNRPTQPLNGREILSSSSQ